MSDIFLSEKIGPAFYDIAHDIFHHGHTHYDFSGGRGSLKSSTVSIIVPLLLVGNPGTHALVLRKVANTIRDSVYAQYIWAIGELGMAAYWEAKVSPMELIYKPTGQKIMFRGADDPMKIKSIKVPFGYIAVTHFEEKDQFAGRAEIRNILQSTMRGGSVFWNFESYNPPISRDNWANKDSLEERADRLCHKSTYLQAPPEWLGEQFLAEAEHLKETDERAYQHEYLGIPVGTGGNVFENLELREITDEEISHFDRIYQGVDYGWFPDPFAFIRVHYDKTRETIYLIDEIYQNKLSNEQSAGMIKAKGYTAAYIICDSAEPKSVADFRAMGLPAKAAVKGPDSVAYGMKWLQRRKIVIDRKRTPHAYDEFVNYEYDRDKDGNFISGYPDEKNHLIDALRYAVEPISRRMGVIA
jgi:PBSX family phage terminase large subunit